MPLSSPKPINHLALLPLLESQIKSSVSVSPAAVWYAPTSSLTTFDLQLLRSATSHYYKFIAAAKKSFYASLVQSSSPKPRALWKTINNILHRTANRSLPTSPLLYFTLSLLPPYTKSTIYSFNHLIHTMISILFLPLY